MALTKIEAEIEIPEGFEFDRMDTKTRKGDYDFDGKAWNCHELVFGSPRVILRKKSKPAKPAYRVYIMKESGNTYTRDSFDGMRDNRLSIGREWLTDWIEYDLPKKWPTPLVERIASIDIKAAEWIVENWDDLLEDRYQDCVSIGMESEELFYMFNWDESPQKDQYWRDIAKQLGE